MIWVIAGAHKAGTNGAANCAHQTLLNAKDCASATDLGTTIGVGLVIGLWVAVDIILGIGYAIWYVTRRRAAVATAE